MDMAVDHLQCLKLLLGWKICRSWTIHGMTSPLVFAAFFFCVSRLRLGRPRTGQGILWCKTWASGVYRAEALPLMAVQWSDQMRGSCHSLRCRFFSITVFVDLLLRRCSPTYLMFFITSILRSVQEKRWLCPYDVDLNSSSAIARSVFLEEQGPERARWHCRSSDL